MNSIDTWFNCLDSFCKQCSLNLLTLQEFENGLRNIIDNTDSPLDGIVFKISCSPPFEDIIIGDVISGFEADVNTIDLSDQQGSQCKINLWRKPKTVFNTQQQNIIYEKLSSLIISYWRSDLRDEKSGILSLQYPATTQIIEKSIAIFLEKRRILCVYFADLDYFKKVNDNFGEKVGDKVIRDTASVLDRSVRPDGIAIHRSGDEFVILYPTDSITNSLLLAYRLWTAMQNYNFGIAPLNLGISMGIATLEKYSDFSSYIELEERAEKAIKPGGGEKCRGKVRLENRLLEITPQERNEFSKNLSLCIIKSNASMADPFASLWLNMVSRFVYNRVHGKSLSEENLKNLIEGILRWDQFTINNDLLRAAIPAEEGIDFSPDVSLLDVAIAAAHGVYRASLEYTETELINKTMEIYFTFRELAACELRLQPDNIIVMKSGEVNQCEKAWDLGGFFFVSNDEHVDEALSRRALLVKIGHFKLKIPSSLFIETIIVDDRPVRGGGLPDFWEATIARLIARLEGNANIEAIYIIGDGKHGAQTIQKLSDLEYWKSNTDFLAYKTGMSRSSILTVAERLDNKVILVSNESELIKHLSQVLCRPYKLKTVTPPRALQKRNRILHRDLRLNGMALGNRDGCRVKSVAEAYPIVLDIARHANDNDGEIVRDAAGNDLRELVDFKVHLTNPKQDMVPTFYAQDEKFLDEYFQREFVNSTGLFGQKFNENGQLNAVIDHIVDVVSNTTDPFATRRAILVVPHEIKHGEDLAPLGLVSVRIVPRFPKGRIQLHYSFTWRTVEAIIGFPYSLYGSVRYSDYLTEEIRKRLPTKYAIRVDMGEVSYVAHSLHIFLDDYGDSIARRIVDDASL